MAQDSRDPKVQESLRHSVRDGVAYAVMTGAGETYFSAYAIFLKASAAQIAFLAAIPQLLGSFMQLLAAWLGSRGARRRTVILTGAVLQALMWLPLIWLPYLYPSRAVSILIGCVILYYAWVSLAAPLWNSLMGDLVPERRRGRFFARRTRLMSATTFASLTAAGVIIHHFELSGETRLGFTIVFTIAAIARVVSIYHLARMHEPKGSASPLLLPPMRDLLPRLRTSQFVPFSLYFAVMSFAVAIAAPFFTLYMLRDLGFSYLQFTVATAMSVVMQFLTLNAWGRLADVFGNRVILAVTGGIIPFLPALWLVSGNFWYIVAIQILAGLSWAGFSLSAGNFLYDLVKPERRAAYSAAHNVLSSFGTFAGALLGGFLATVAPATIATPLFEITWTSGLWAVLLTSALVRGAVALVFVHRLKEVRDVRPLSASGLMFRVIRYNALAGMVFDLMAPRSKRGRGTPRDGAG